MKKSLVLVAMAGVALASCVNNEVVDVPQKEQEKVRIAFDKPVTYSNVDSRVNYYGEIGEHEYSGVKRSYPKEEEFTIFAVWDAKNQGFDGWPTDNNSSDFAKFNGNALTYDFYVDSWAPKEQVAKKDANGAEVKDNEGNPVYESHYYYWPGDQFLSYVAYSPSDLTKFYKVEVDNENKTITKTEKDGVIVDTPTISYGNYQVGETKYLGLKIDNFQTPTNPENHYDLLFSQLEINKASANMNHNAGSYSGLPITFQHALSCIRFSFETDEDNTPIYLQEIKLKGAKTKNGHFAENILLSKITSWTNFDYDRKSEEANAEFNVEPKWTFVENEEHGEEVEFTAFAKADDDTYHGVQFTGMPTYVEGQINATKGDKYYNLYLMPQELTNVMITVKFKVGDSGTVYNKTYSLNNLYHYEDTQKDNPISTWEIGKRYAYRLYYSAEAAKKDRILFSPSTDGWKDVEGIIVDLAHSGDDAQASN